MMRVILLLIGITFSNYLPALPKVLEKCVNELQRITSPYPHFKKTVKVKFMCFFGEAFSGLHLIRFREQIREKGFDAFDFNIENGPSVDVEKTEDLSSRVLPDRIEMTRRIVGQDYVVIVFNTHGVLQEYQHLLNWLHTPEAKNYIIKKLEDSVDFNDRMLVKAFREDKVKLPKIYYSGDVTTGNNFAIFDHSELFNRIISDQKLNKNFY